MAHTNELSDAIEAGWTLPANWYVDDDIFALERERIFERSWQYVCNAASLEQPGDFVTAEIGRIPIVVVRNQAAELAAFVNVCRHRCAEVVLGSGHRNVLQCHYHAWTYDLDGQLVSAPRSEREADFDPSDFCLEKVRVESWGSLVFANVSAEGPSLADQLGPLPALMAGEGVDFGSVRLRERSEWEVAANWKIVVENFDECYHCAVAHPSFSRVMEVGPDSYRLESGEWWSRATTPLRPWPEGRRPALPYDPAGLVSSAQFAFFWPNFTLVQNPGPSNLMALYFVPKGPEHTVVISEYLFGEDASPETIHDMMEFNLLVGAEDQRLVESVQRGMRSGRIPRGRLLLDSEHLIQHFQRLVHRALTA
ncbi:MAG: aromatic ring-hydroxylating dioxygenase subunit alpha [Acidimicrobiales bacterium]|jgi:phenylpropionate dioxygenase-like ring-hydroxylating dioxygenase large terminal subunit